jgi:excisionase family DNA binding protein
MATPTDRRIGDRRRSGGTEPALLLTVEEAARRLRIGRTTAYALIADGDLESVPVGRLRRVPTEALTEYVAKLRRAARSN